MSVAELEKIIEALRPLHTPLGKPQPGDWLDRFDEPGQTFREYINGKPVVPQGTRRRIYLQPLGKFTDAQRKIVALTADFMGRFFDREVTVRDGLSLDLVPKEARRENPFQGQEQILTSYVLDKVLKPRLPEDAAVYLALTASDLWPGAGWNFVFGQASLRERVGVWSLYRKGDPAKSDDAFRFCLLRTLKTAVHETGHMFSMQHCTAFECGMCGSNSLAESDRRPLAFCPPCTAKVCWATGTDPAARYRKLAEFCTANGLKDEAAFYEKSLRALGEKTELEPASTSSPSSEKKAETGSERPSEP